MKEKIAYTYIKNCQQETGERVCDRAKAISAAVDALDAVRLGADDEYAYHASEGDGTEWYKVTGADLAELGSALLDGIDYTDIYSIWCSTSGSMLNEEECEEYKIEDYRKESDEDE